MRKLIVLLICIGFVVLSTIKMNRNKMVTCVMTDDLVECLISPQDIVQLQLSQSVYLHVQEGVFEGIITLIGHEPIVETMIVYPITIQIHDYQSSFKQFPVKITFKQGSSNFLLYIFNKIIQP